MNEKSAMTKRRPFDGDAVVAGILSSISMNRCQ